MLLYLIKSKSVSLGLGLLFGISLGISILLTPTINFVLFSQTFAQSDLLLVKHRNLVIDLGDGVTTKAQLSYPAIGKGPFPGVLLIKGSGANDKNETGGLILIDNKTSSKTYPIKQTFFQISEYLAERGFAVLKYDEGNYFKLYNKL